MTTGGALFGDHSAVAFGTLSLMFCALAACWNIGFNWLFERWERVKRKGKPRTLPLRIAHALLFEAGMFTAGALLVAWWLKMPLRKAMLLDLGLAAFFALYALCFNWAYDLIFPVADESSQLAAEGPPRASH